MTIEILKPGASGYKRPPTDPPSNLRCTTQTNPTRAPAEGSVTRQWSARSRPPNGPHWQPPHRRGPRLDLQNSEGPSAHPAIPEATRWLVTRTATHHDKIDAMFDYLNRVLFSYINDSEVSKKNYRVANSGSVSIAQLP
jgi:hypothetical protein